MNRMGFVTFTKLPLLSNFLTFLFILIKESSAKSFAVSSSSQYAVANQDFILTCTTTYIPTAITWTRDGTDVVYMQLNSNECRYVDVGSGLSSNYRYNCTDNKTYNLIIPRDRIQQEDGSKWQCKDSAGDSDINKTSIPFNLILARSPTSDPVVTGYSSTILYTGNTTKLSCTVQGGTPLATLSWTCKGSSVTGVDKSTTETAINEVTVNINSSYNRQMCVCKAEHLSWTTDKTAESQQFVVYYPPSSDPIVSGYDGSKLYVNNGIVLSCQVTGGYPLATLSWTCDEQDYPGTNRSVVNTTISELSITATANLNGKSCTCKGRHPVNSYSKDINSTTFLVYYAPSESPVITGYVSGQPIYKGNKQLDCKVAGGYPLSILTMTCNNNVISGTDQSTSTESKFIYNINVDKAYNKQQCICNGRHPNQNIGYNRNTSVTFNVYFAPETAPEIRGYTNNEILYETEKKNISCILNGGNPVATLTWKCRGSTKSDTNHSIEGEARSTITLNINRDYNNKQCICTATHPAENYNRQTDVTFTVYFPPTLPVVTDNFTSFPWLEGGRGSLLCSSSPGNPPSSYRWKANEVLVTEEKGQMILFTGLTKEFNLRNYSCEVYNDYTTHTDQHLWSPHIPLNVEYSPVISVGITPTFIREGKDFTRPCTAQGNPEPSIKWIYGNQNSEVLQFVNSNRNQTGKYTCDAIGRSVKYGDLKSQKDLTVIVQYPPTVTVLLSNVINGQTSDIVCTAKGVPDNYNYTSWTQMYGGVVIRKGLNFGSLSSKNSRLTLTNVSYQDIGIYKCTAHNTIKDKYGELEQQGSAYLNISFPSAFMQNSQRKFYAELDHKVDIEIPFFSNPSLDNGSITISKSDKIYLDFDSMEFSLQVKKTSLNLTFHGTDIKINGQKSIFVIHSFKEDHKGNYTMNLTTSNGLTSSCIFEIIPSGPPGQPYKLLILGNTTTSITVGWASDFNGGYPQTFVIMYTPVNNKDKPKEVRVNEIEHKRNYNYTLINLNPGTEYLIWIYSFNRKGNSTQDLDSEKLASKTQAKKDDDSNFSMVIGVVSAFTVVLVIVLSIVAGIFFYRRRGAKGKDRSLINDASSRRSVDDTDNEDGMRDNVLYEPAGPNFVPKTKQNKDGVVGGKNGDIYSEVRKPGKKQDGGASSDVYAIVQKKPKSAQGSEANSSDIYSEVKKTKKYIEGTLYENMETSFNKQGSNTDENPGPSGGIKPNTEKPQKPPKPAKQKRNKDGLIYADLILDEPTMDGKQFVIHGIEDKTDYAEVDFSRKADPLPPETDDNVKEAAQ